MMKKIHFNSIFARFIGAAMLFILIISAVAGFVSISLSLKYADARFHDNFKVLSSYLAKNAELGLLLKDESMLTKLVDNMLELDDIFSVKIMDIPKTFLIMAGENRDSLVSVNKNVFLTEHDAESFFIPSIKKNRLLGTVEVGYSLESLNKLKNSMIYYFSWIMFFFIMLFLLCFFLLSRSVALPLQRIVNISKTVSQGNMDVRIDLKDAGVGPEEVKTLASGFNTMLDVLQSEKFKTEKANKEVGKQKTLAEVGRFSMLVAHEVKNPLTVIKGSLDLLKKDNLDTALKQELIIYIEDDIQRINKIVEDFLLYAKPKSVNYANIDMNDFTSKVVEKFFFLNENIEIKSRIEKSIALVNCDCAMMETVLLNILNNAFQFASKQIEVTTKVYKDKWSLQIVDDGKGIAKEYLKDNAKRVFTPFFTTRAKGTGLGLAIVKDIVDMHKGKITAGNAASGGAVFEIIMECV